MATQKEKLRKIGWFDLGVLKHYYNGSFALFKRTRYRFKRNAEGHVLMYDYQGSLEATFTGMKGNRFCEEFYGIDSFGKKFTLTLRANHLY